MGHIETNKTLKQRKQQIYHSKQTRYLFPKATVQSNTSSFSKNIGEADVSGRWYIVYRYML